MKNYSAVVIGVLWLLSLAGAYFVGLHSSPRFAAGEGENRSASTQREQYPVAGGGHDFTVTDRKSLPRRSDGGMSSSSDFATALASAIEGGDLVTRSLALAGLLEQLDEGNLEDAKTFFLGFSGERGHRGELELFLHAWARFDPQGALAFANDDALGRFGKMASYSVLDGWAGRDFPAALEWSLQQEGGERDRALTVILSNQAGDSPESALATLQSLSADALSPRLYQQVARSIARSDPGLASQWATSIHDDQGRQLAMWRVAQEWSKNDPQAAAVWVQQFASDSVAGKAAGEVVQQLVNDDLEFAKQWVSGLQGSDVRSVAMSDLVNQWSKQDPNAAGIWLNQQPPGSGLDKAVGVFSRRIMESDPAASIAWAETIEADGARNSLLVELGRYWHAQDPTAAAVWVAQSGLSEGSQRSVLSTEQGSRVREPWRRLR